MKILVVGLDCAAPEVLLGGDPLPTFRRLMDRGCYGRLESVIPPITVPAWMCLCTSQDPGSLGVYGFRNRADHSYGKLAIVTSRSIRQPAIWDHLAREGKKANVIGVPPGFPPRQVNGVSVGCFLTPDTRSTVFTHPASASKEITTLVGEYPVDVKGFRTDDKAWLKDEIYAVSRKQFEVVRHYLQHSEWDYFQFVEIGLDRMHHGFWKHHDPTHRLHDPGSPYLEAVRDYYRYLDEQVGRLLELVTEDTAVAVVSDHGAQRLDGGFCVNEWLVQQGLLVLNDRPKVPTPFERLDVNWDRTQVWSEGGYYARVFFNVRGREPRGTIDASEYERFRDDVKAMFEATTDEQGRTLGTLAFRPQEIYRAVRNVAPDLIVHFGGLYWRSIGSVGHGRVHVQENDSGPDDCNHAQFGSLILAEPASRLRGEITGAHLLDVAPTLLELAGYDLPPSMAGRSLLTAGPSLEGRAERPLTPGTPDP
jgi:predicted AlkP superfamily phosphohydrolase/phosphomutase